MVYFFMGGSYHNPFHHNISNNIQIYQDIIKKVIIGKLKNIGFLCFNKMNNGGFEKERRIVKELNKKKFFSLNIYI